jgi:hypothetical protein
MIVVIQLFKLEQVLVVPGKAEHQLQLNSRHKAEDFNQQ